MHSIDSMIVWNCMTLKSGFRFQIIPALGVWASDTSNLPMAGYLLELVCDRSLFGATKEDEVTLPGIVPESAYPNLGVIIR
jgi:hypothetical protein